MTSINRVKQASALRGRSQNLGSLKKLLIPVLEDTIESSIKLAASMSTRGFGRTSEMSKNEVFWVKSCSLASLALFVIGAFLVLTLGLLQPASITTLVTGLLLSVVSLKISSRKQIRTKLKQRKFQFVDLIALAAPAACFFAAAQGWIS
jgi:energy-coupling factor transport system permease protein